MFTFTSFIFQITLILKVNYYSRQNPVQVNKYHKAHYLLTFSSQFSWNVCHANLYALVTEQLHSVSLSYYTVWGFYSRKRPSNWWFQLTYSVMAPLVTLIPTCTFYVHETSELLSLVILNSCVTTLLTTVTTDDVLLWSFSRGLNYNVWFIREWLSCDDSLNGCYLWIFNPPSLSGVVCLFRTCICYVLLWFYSIVVRVITHFSDIKRTVNFEVRISVQVK